MKVFRERVLVDQVVTCPSWGPVISLAERRLNTQTTTLDHFILPAYVTRYITRSDVAGPQRSRCKEQAAHFTAQTSDAGMKTEDLFFGPTNTLEH